MWSDLLVTKRQSERLEGSETSIQLKIKHQVYSLQQPEDSQENQNDWKISAQRLK